MPQLSWCVQAAQIFFQVAPGITPREALARRGFYDGRAVFVV
jgi:hypothetical protein